MIEDTLILALILGSIQVISDRDFKGKNGEIHVMNTWSANLTCGHPCDVKIAAKLSTWFIGDCEAEPMTHLLIVMFPSSKPSRTTIDPMCYFKKKFLPFRIITSASHLI